MTDRSPHAPHIGPPQGADSVDVLIDVLDEEMGVPDLAHPGDAGVDLRTRTDVSLAPGERALVGTGIAIALPPGFAAFVHPRSGLAARLGVSLVNTPGTIDAGYRGEIQVVLINHDLEQSVDLQRGDRIAQLVFQRVAIPRFHRVERLPGSHRGEAGFGSSGVSGVSGSFEEAEQG